MLKIDELKMIVIYDVHSSVHLFSVTLKKFLTGIQRLVDSFSYTGRNNVLC
jgi:hypothetical protein